MAFIDNSDAVKKAMHDAQLKALYAIGELLYAAIRPLIPVDTTALITSLDYVVDESEMSVTVGVNTDYAIYVEFGTGEYAENGNGRKGGWAYVDEDTGKTIFTMGMHPQPYMRPGYRSSKAKIKTIIEETMKAYIGDGKITIRKVK